MFKNTFLCYFFYWYLVFLHSLLMSVSKVFFFTDHILADKSEEQLSIELSVE